MKYQVKTETLEAARNLCWSLDIMPYDVKQNMRAYMESLGIRYSEKRIDKLFNEAVESGDLQEAFARVVDEWMDHNSERQP